VVEQGRIETTSLEMCALSRYAPALACRRYSTTG
jgi:hypothetical protein